MRAIIAVLVVIGHSTCLRVNTFSCSTRRPTRTPLQASTGRVHDNDPMFTEITPDQYAGELPTQFNYPFNYEPHPIAVLACDQVKEQLVQFDEEVGKMFGVLIVRTPDQRLGYIKAYSGTLKNPLDGFCPLVYDRFVAEGFYKRGEEKLNVMNREVEELEQDPERVHRKAHLAAVEDNAQESLTKARQQQKANKRERKERRLEMKSALDPEEYLALEADLAQESAADQRQVRALKAQLEDEVARAQASAKKSERRLEDLKHLRKEMSANLQNRLFVEYQFLNVRGEKASLLDIFAETPLLRPPGGAGDCAAPKLLQDAFARGYAPITMAEFWWGDSPALEVRKHNFYYPACRGKCEPILGHMLQGLDVEDNPLEQVPEACAELEIIYEDEYMVVVNKPCELLSVPGRLVEQSVYTEMAKRYPESTGPLLVHRLDMSTSGILLVAKDKDTHKQISAQFIDRSIKKRYESLLEGECKTRKGKIDLPLIGDYLNRPMQKVDFDGGKPAETFYEVVEISDGRTRIYFYPVTGRTHQLRVHAAHAMGLNLPIVGDDIYGQRDERLCLHAGFLQMTHPVTQERMTFTADAPF
jgi:tRNA pseudouridine32 synthase/23S rRNA pseudouridine746 synthase